jgi:chromosome segregation ATPase
MPGHTCPYLSLLVLNCPADVSALRRPICHMPAEHDSLQAELESVGGELAELRQLIAEEASALQTSVSGRSELKKYQSQVAALVQQMAQRTDRLEAVLRKRKTRLSAVDDAKRRLGLVEHRKQQAAVKRPS